MRVRIIGRGLQARVAALCCAHAGLGDIRLMDTGEPEDLPVVELPPNATRVLVALELRAALDEIAYVPLSELYRTAATGYGLAYRPMGPFAEARYGSPHFHCLAGTLSHLLDRALADRGVTIEEQDPDPLEPADVVLIAAPGVAEDSGYPTAIQPDTTGSPSAVTQRPAQWQTAVAWDDVTGGPLLNWSDEGCYARQIPVREGTCTVIVRDRPADSVRILRRLNIVADLSWKPFVQTSWHPDWHAGHLVLIGAAAHPLPPFGGQEFALALEDAWVIARMLALHDDHLPTAMSEYQRFRRPRARRMLAHLQSLAAGHEQRSPLRRLASNWSLALRYRLLPELAMQRDDWQFEYDCVKGFD